MRRAKPVGLESSEQVALRRIAYEIVNPRDLKTTDVEHLISLNLVVMRGSTLALTPLGDELLQTFPQVA